MAKMINVERKDTNFFIPARELLAVWNAVSSEQTRYYLNGVFVEQDSAGLLMTATTGHILLNARLDEGAFMGAKVSTQGDKHSRGFILQLDPTDKALKAKTRGDAWLYGDTESGIVQVLDVHDVTDTEHARVGVVEFTRIDGQFPDWRRVMPVTDPGSEGVAAALNLDLLDDMRRAASHYASRKGTAPVRLTTGKAGDPIRVEFLDAPRLTGVVMPFRWQSLPRK